ncbi:MAG: aquaporin family protein [Alphaproteobacteria bacterium]|nr:aquaporin family protein [Alphaproteobacteria bacterium SS10]
MTVNTARALAAEALGTAFLLMTVVGSGIMAERLADGNVAIALLGNTIPTGAILVVLITLFGPISGAHFNPAVTLAFLMRREISAVLALGYVAVQVVAGVLGTLAAHAMFEHPLLVLGIAERTGPGQWLAEFIATFGLVLTILVALRHAQAAIPWLVGLYITAAYWFTASTSFANPAVTIARLFTDTFAGIRPIDAPGFIAAQLVGAVAAVFVVRWLISPASDAETTANN